MQLEDLAEGLPVRFTFDGEAMEGDLTDIDGGQGTAIVCVESEDGEEPEFFEVDVEDITEARKSAWDRLVESDPELAGEILEEELTAMLGPEDPRELLETSIDLIERRMGALRTKAPRRAQLMTGKLKKRRPNAERLSAFMRSQRGRRGRRNWGPNPLRGAGSGRRSHNGRR